ncbi:uncharacterized protein LOC131157596 isoform X2 [Malania oleifera]|uniref:uncharacterized protein LOC131157596 isoform X2 n=1 Tax=Malania oleifera TaxID=397392 RepID=UPI0025AE1A0C|nr:uncharacterized protein LOC131157596 isoform X2 [Malania oleifera]
MDSSVSSRNDRQAENLEDSWCSKFYNGPNPWLARYIYGVLFLITNLLAWAVRDYGPHALAEMERLDICQGERDCVGADGVLRVSLGCFTFYFIMFLSTAGTSKLHDHRELWHSRWWSAKIILWIALMIIPFFIPFSLIQIYGEVAHFGAGVFLLIQLISVISFIRWLNDCCQSDKYGCHFHVMLLATIAYVVCLVGIILMYIWYAPEASCLLNIFFITWTLVLLQLMTSVSLHPKVNAGFLTPGLMGLYVVFICWSAIRSEPPEERCDKKAEAATKADWLTIISFIIALLAMVIATFSTGIDSQCFQFRKDDMRAEHDVPYGYGFFHFVFAMGSMYLAMLLISWNTNHAMRKWTIDVGWTSTWVRVVNEWLAACVYIWMLIAPIVWKSRQTVEPV